MANVPITTNAPRTLVALLARGTARASVGIGTGTTKTFEIGNDPAKTYLTGDTLDLNFLPADGIPDIDHLIFIAANNGHEDNLTRGVQVWRTLNTTTPGLGLDMRAATWGSDNLIASAPFSISRRGSGAHTTGKIGEILLFDRILSETELTQLKDYLIVKWHIGETSDGSEFNGITFDIAPGGILDLGGRDRPGVTVTGTGAITNGTLGAGFTVSPAGDHATGALTLTGVTPGPGSTYRLTTAGPAGSDLLHIDGDLTHLTIVPADLENLPAAGPYTIATGAITHKPALSSDFPSKYSLRLSGPDLILTTAGGTLLILK